MTAYTIKSAEGNVVVIADDFTQAEELSVFLNEIATLSTDGNHTITETTQADIDELAAQEVS
jgi:hypothetical protein